MPRVTDEHRAARRQQILAAASRCVAREGFHRTTMADVITEAGLSAGAVYGYFKSKDDIIRAIADIAIGEAAHVLEDLAERPDAVEPADAVGLFVYRIANLADTSEVDVTRLAVQAWSEAVRDPRIHTLAREKMGDLRAALETVVRRCQADGTVSRHAEPRAAAQVLFSLLPGFVLQRLILEDVTPESYVAGVRSLLSRA